MDLGSTLHDFTSCFRDQPKTSKSCHICSSGSEVNQVELGGTEDVAVLSVPDSVINWDFWLLLLCPEC